MGKEATIGLAVILILLITLGVVLVRRLNGSTDPAAASPAEANDEGSSQAGSTAGDDAQSEPSAATPRKLTILTGEPASSETPRLRPVPVNRFAVAADGEGESAGTGDDVGRVPPPLPPSRSAPGWTHRGGDYDGGVHQLDAPQIRQLPSARVAGSAGGNEPYDPLEDQAAQTAAADTDQVGQMPGRLRSLGPPQHMPRQPGASGYGDRNSGGYSSDASSAEQTPAWGQTSPYSSAARPRQTPPPAGHDAGFGPPRSTADVRNADGQYQVQPNDNYWVISQRLYGSGAYFKALAEHNGGKVPREDQLDVGDVIYTPSVPELEKAYPELCPKPSRRETVRSRASLVSARTPYRGGRIYVVEEGDTLFDVARHLLGKASRWVEIYQLNRDLIGDDPSYINAGMELVVPEDEPAERVTQRPRPSYRP
jgi:nucleoid-associated protein YgaU